MSNKRYISMPQDEPMKERPILFSAPMVLAILEGRKMQTRRVVYPQPPVGFIRVAEHHLGDAWNWAPPDRDDAFWPDGSECWKRCPQGAPGDHLWVREAWQFLECDFGSPNPSVYIIGYRGGREGWPKDPKEPYKGDERTQWQSVPPESWAAAHRSFDGAVNKWRSPIFMPRWASRLTIEVVSVRPERLQDIGHEDVIAEGLSNVAGSSEWFPKGWDTLNAKRGYPWKSDPWVWRIEFKRTEDGEP